jgi:hypothetical protein
MSAKESPVQDKTVAVNRRVRKGGKKKRAAESGTRPYPSRTLADALKIPYAIKEKNGGNAWPPEDVARAVGISKKGVRFWYLSAASRDFGLTEGTRDSKLISLTELGKSLVYAPSVDEENALKIKAFLKVDVFKRVLDHYKGSKLPEMQYLSNTLVKEFNLASKFHKEFSELFSENCKYLKLSDGYTSGGGAEDPGAEVGKTESVGGQSVVTLAETPDAKRMHCFVIMPFLEREPSHAKGFFDEVLRSLIVPAGAEAGFTIKTANRAGSDVIQATIVNNILDADLVLVDLTEHNPNVLFELGMRMAMDKPVALIRAKGTTAIFDVDNMLRVFDYDPNLWRSTIEKDLPQLVVHIKAVWDARKSQQTYMKILKGTKLS